MKVRYPEIEFVGPGVAMHNQASNQMLKPLKCEIVDGVLTIQVSADVVKFATENHPTFWDGDKNTLKVSDEAKWLRSVAYRMNDEREDGSSLLTDMLDKAIESAVEQGEEGLQDE